MGVRSGPKIPSRGSEFELVTNGSFPVVADGETGYDNGDGTVDGWTKYGSPTLSITTVGGRRCLKILAAGNGQGAATIYPVTSGITYIASLEIVTRTASTVYLRVGTGINATGMVASNTLAATGVLSVEFTATSNDADHYITILHDTTSSNYVEITNVSVKPVTSPLVLSLDAMNAKSFAGEPTTNLVTDGDCNDGSIPDNTSFGYESTATIVNCPTDDAGFKPSAKAIKLVKNNGSNGRITFFGSLGTLSTGSGNPYTVSCWFYIPRTSTGTGGTGGTPRWASDNGANSADIAFHRTYHQDDKGTWVKLISEWYSVSGGHTHGFRVTSGDPVGALYYMTEVQVEKKDHSTPFVDGSRPVADAWKDLSGNDNHGTFSAEDFGAASQDYFLVRKGGILLPASTALAPQINNPTGGGGLRANPDFPASINFDGTDDHIDCGSNAIFDSLPTFTACIWFKMSNLSSDMALLSKGTYPSAYSFFIQARPTQSGASKSYHARLTHDGSSSTVVNGAADNTWVADTWYHLVLIHDGTNAYYYQNGEENGAKTAVGYTIGPGATSGTFKVGRTQGDESKTLDGRAACVQFYTTALTHAQIKDMYNSQKSRFGL